MSRQAVWIKRLLLCIITLALSSIQTKETIRFQTQPPAFIVHNANAAQSTLFPLRIHIQDAYFLPSMQNLPSVNVGKGTRRNGVIEGIKLYKAEGGGYPGVRIDDRMYFVLRRGGLSLGASLNYVLLIQRP